MSRPVRMSPLKIRTGSSGPECRRGGDVADRAAGAERLLLGDVLDVQAERRNRRRSTARRPRPGRRWRGRCARRPAALARASWWVRNGTPAAGTMGFGVCTVSGRSRVPLPPTRRIASVICRLCFLLGPAGIRPASVSRPCVRAWFRAAGDVDGRPVVLRSPGAARTGRSAALERGRSWSCGPSRASCRGALPGIRWRTRPDGRR